MNPFEAVADQQQNAYSKARDRAAEKRLAKLVVKSEADAPMVASPSDRAMYERNALMRQYNKAMTQRRLDLLAGPFGEQIKGLLQILDSLTSGSVPALTSYLAKCQWFLQADRSIRMDILSVISIAIARHRVKMALAPYDDSLPGEPPTAFEIIRTNLKVLS